MRHTLSYYYKRLIRPLCLSALSIPLLSACLDESPRDRISGDEAYATANALYINAVSTLYNHFGATKESEGLQGTYRGIYDYNTLTTDEAIIPVRGGDWYDGGYWTALYQHTWTPSDASIYRLWCYLYKVVGLCDASLEAIDTHRQVLTDAQYDAYHAEVKAIRAMYYYQLCDLFGSVPLTANAGGGKQMVQYARSEIYRLAFDELQAALPYLPTGRSNQEGAAYGRMTRGVAYFLLARLALNAEVYSDDDWTDGHRPDGKNIYFTVNGQKLNAWQTTVAYCDSLTLREGYELSDDYAANFKVHNEESVENILTIPMDKMVYTNQYLYLFRSRHYAHGSALGMDSENGTSATRSTVQAYGYGTPSVDKRYAVNFFSDTVRVDGSVVRLDDGTPLIYRPLEIKPNLTGDPYEKTAGARMAKYEIDRTAHADGKLSDNDIVIFRYADVLLMKAEALIRQGMDGSAPFNAVRRRAGMPDRLATLDNILTERLLELMWEGCRRPDLIRFGRFTTSYDQRTALPDEEATGYTTVFPIPADALKLSPELKQHKGY